VEEFSDTLNQRAWIAIRIRVACAAVAEVIHAEAQPSKTMAMFQDWTDENGRAYELPTEDPPAKKRRKTKPKPAPEPKPEPEPELPEDFEDLVTLIEDRMPHQRALPGTRVLDEGEVENTTYRMKLLVHSRIGGIVRQWLFPRTDEGRERAHQCFLRETERQRLAMNPEAAELFERALCEADVYRIKEAFDAAAVEVRGESEESERTVAGPRSSIPKPESCSRITTTS
jgi:hypothetical protein